MTDEDLPGDISAVESNPLQKSRWYQLWQGLSQAGLAETALRLGTHILLVALILIVAWGLREFYNRAQIASLPQAVAQAADLPTPPPQEAAFTASFKMAAQPSSNGVTRRARLHTDVPSRPRVDLLTYAVKPGDTVFGIADKFGLQPETILWGNQLVLGDNPHNLKPGQELKILPVDGALHRWSAGDGLNGVAKFFNVEPEAIVDWPGNNLNTDTVGDFTSPNIEPGTWLIIPDGKREFVSWSMPVIPIEDPSVAKVLGDGACGSAAQGAVGAGVFIWPANNHFLSGFDYNPNANHSGIDIDGDAGQPVYAADNGVVVFAGWNNWGYGNVVILNHGNGWQTLYAHLSAINVVCGQSVYQTNLLGAIGNTGNSAGAHLHFEMMYNGTKVNPWDYLP